MEEKKTIYILDILPLHFVRCYKKVIWITLGRDNSTFFLFIYIFRFETRFFSYKNRHLLQNNHMNIS